MGYEPVPWCPSPIIFEFPDDLAVGTMDAYEMCMSKTQPLVDIRWF